MTYQFRKCGIVVVFLFVCVGYCEGATGNVTNVTGSIDFDFNYENVSSLSYSQQSDEIGEPVNTTLNSTFYSVETQNYDYDDFDTLIMESENLKNLNFPHSYQALYEAMKKISNIECINETNDVLSAIGRREKWALQLFDSFPKFPENILYGNFYQLGNFDECLGAKQDANIGNGVFKKPVQGQYCLADIRFKKKSEKNVPRKEPIGNMALENNRASFDNSLIHWAMCLPSSCKAEDVEIFVHEIFLSFIQRFEIISVNVDSKKCETDKTIPITTSELVYGSIVGIFLMFTILATVIHIWYLKKIRKSAMYNVDDLREKQSNFIKETLICFSVINTTERFFHTKPNDLNLESICGVKFISMVLIIAGHSLIFFFGGPIANMNFFLEVTTKVEHGIFMNSPIIVDTFLLISGFLMCRLMLIELDRRKGRVNFLILYIARYIRLTPAYAVVLGLYTTFLYRMGSGPFWESKVGLERQRCDKSWWINLLYINNYVGTENPCMFQSWYLAVDFHLFILAPFIIYLLWKKPKVGEIVLLACTVASIATPFWLTYQDKLDPTVMAFPPEIEDLSTNFYFLNYYTKTHMRISSYCIGLFYAYLVHKLQGSMIKIPRYIVILGWIFAILFATASMFSIIIFYDPHHNVNIVENAMYASLHRVTWSLSIGWILLVCITDNAGFVNKFLSHKFFIPASRLTYCAYLTNGLVEIYSAGIARQPMYMSIFELVCKTCGHIFLTFALAFVLCIIFESPIHGMEKILMKNFDTRKEKPRNSVLSVAEL